MSELEEKTQRIAAMLGREGFDAVLLNARHNFAWLSGGGASGIDVSRENGAATLMVTRSGRRFVLANNIEMPRVLTEEIPEADFEPVAFTWQEEKSTADLVLRKAKTLLAGGTEVATDIAFFSGAAAIENKVAACRYELTRDESDRYRKLGRDAGEAVRRVIEGLVPGQTETEIAENIRHEFAGSGMTTIVTLVAADERISLFRHPVPGGKRWNRTVLLVICAVRHGLVVSLSRIVCAGDVPGELKDRTEAAAYVNACLLDQTRPGVSGAALYTAAANAYAEKGFADEIDKHHQGGAAGYKTREWVAHPHSTEIVHVNQAFAWNPSITGTKVEETYISTESGVDIITASPDYPQIATTVNGREYFSPGIFSL